MDFLETFLKIVQQDKTTGLYAIVAAVLYGCWKFATRALILLTQLFKETKEEISQTKSLFIDLTKEFDRLNANLEKTVEISTQRFAEIDRRIERVEDAVDALSGLKK